MEKKAYYLTREGRQKAEAYIRGLEAKRREILDAGKDAADETDLPGLGDIEDDIALIGVEWDGSDGPCYYNGWGVTDSYESDGPLNLVYGQDFVEGGYVPSDDDTVIIAEQYTSGSYMNMIPGTVVLDYALSSYWNVLENDGKTVKLQNVKGGKNGARMDVSDETCHNTFVLFTPLRDSKGEITRSSGPDNRDEFHGIVTGPAKVDSHIVYDLEASVTEEAEA